MRGGHIRCSRQLSFLIVNMSSESKYAEMSVSKWDADVEWLFVVCSDSAFFVEEK